MDLIEQKLQVRQGLKDYSRWPTFPQLYLNGELIGGLDVFKEELNNPEFRNKLPKLKISLCHQFVLNVFKTMSPISLFENFLLFHTQG